MIAVLKERKQLQVNSEFKFYLSCDENVILNSEVTNTYINYMDNAGYWINHYLVDSVVCFVNTYPLDSDLSGG